MEKRICKHCGKTFDLTKKDKLFCTVSCYNKMSYFKHRDKRLIAKKEYWQKNKTHLHLKSKEWSLKNREKVLSIKAKHYQKIKDNSYFKLKAKTVDLIRLDKKKRPYLYPEECCICGKTEKIEFHHPNYEFPYLVYPLCKQHHVQIHWGKANE